MKIASPTIIGTTLGSLLGFVLFAPMVITHRTTENDGWWHVSGGVVVAVMGFLIGLLLDFKEGGSEPNGSDIHDSN